MNLEIIQSIDKIFLTVEDIQRVLKISKKSALVTASRYVSAKLLIRLKREMYILPQRLKTLTENEYFEIANLLQTPSYISLTTALSYYNITTQQTPNFYESVALKRTREFEVLGKEFNFTLVKKDFYFGFVKKENFFIASPEKALADAIYLTAIGKYNADFDAIDFLKLDKDKITATINYSNKAVKNLWQKLISNYAI